MYMYVFLFYVNFRVHGYGNQCCYDGSGLLMNPEALFGSGYANRYHYADGTQTDQTLNTTR
jgi:hypothetical protein